MKPILIRIVLITLALCLTHCSSSKMGFDKNVAIELVKAYYQSYPYMLKFPEQSEDDIRFGGDDFMKSDDNFKAENIEVKIIEVGKKNENNQTAIRVNVRADYTRLSRSKQQGTELIGIEVVNQPVQKEAVFYIGENDFRKPMIRDQYGLRRVSKK